MSFRKPLGIDISKTPFDDTCFNLPSPVWWILQPLGKIKLRGKKARLLANLLSVENRQMSVTYSLDSLPSQCVAFSLERRKVFVRAQRLRLN
ncbi:MAG: hypothetical protein J7647_23850 [Cyanobacteria bacterium SBLK]|nr:hypothetical protein [Cyanobacteria bacterium SBLK]